MEVAPSRQEKEEYTMYQVNSKRSTKPLMVEVKLNGVTMQMEVDTGASVSLMGKAHFKSLKEKGATLSPPKQSCQRTLERQSRSLAFQT